MLSKRIIVCMDVKDGKVVKGVKFKNHKVLGDIIDLSQKYESSGADELVFYDICASADNRTINYDWISEVADKISIPFCVAGGITSVEKARKAFSSGADKISINSPALNRPELINELVDEFGSQSIVVGIDSQWLNDDYYVYKYTGRESTCISSRKRTLDWVKEVTNRGAGEIVLNSMNSDGTKSGYDIKQLNLVKDISRLPIVASGGAGSMSDFKKLFKNSSINSALAAGVFHRDEISIENLKLYLKMSQIEVRL